MPNIFEGTTDTTVTGHVYGKPGKYERITIFFLNILLMLLPGKYISNSIKGNFTKTIIF